MGDMEKTALQERGVATYRNPTLAEVIEDCDPLGISLRDVVLEGRHGVVTAVVMTASAPDRGRP